MFIDRMLSARVVLPALAISLGSLGPSVGPSAEETSLVAPRYQEACAESAMCVRWYDALCTDPYGKTIINYLYTEPE